MLAVVFAGCGEERKYEEVRKPVKHKEVTSQPELYASEEESITFTLKDRSPDEAEVIKLKKKNFGISRVENSGNKLKVFYDPSFIDPDSLKKIFAEFIK
jgi:hypothetical protein